MRFCQWLLFNLFTGNNDNHAKNLSLYQPPGQGVRLTPFYDLMCTRLYPGLSREFAFAIGGEFRPGAMTRAHLSALAGQLGMRSQFLAQQAADLANQLPGALERSVDEVKPMLSPSARLLAGKLRQFVLGTTRKMVARLTA
jgi:serine/threonine-protein kinase HipA